ncbi:MAG TPA: DinB family protein [Terriglobales bacterium]|nr:DinB family protein [Terriglobales bacterium]
MNLIDLGDLIAYTDWERQQWHECLREHGDAVLQTSAGPHGDGRLSTVGEIVRHIFSAEKRYVDRLSGRELTDTASIPTDSVDRLFAFGDESRSGLREFISTFPPQKWDALEDHKIMTSTLRATPRKFIVHVVMHEIRHWAQIATLLRLSGLKTDFHDFLFSPVFGGELIRGVER